MAFMRLGWLSVFAIGLAACGGGRGDESVSDDGQVDEAALTAGTLDGAFGISGRFDTPGERFVAQSSAGLYFVGADATGPYAARRHKTLALDTTYGTGGLARFVVPNPVDQTKFTRSGSLLPDGRLALTGAHWLPYQYFNAGLKQQPAKLVIGVVSADGKQTKVNEPTGVPDWIDNTSPNTCSGAVQAGEGVLALADGSLAVGLGWTCPGANRTAARVEHFDLVGLEATFDRLVFDSAHGALYSTYAREAATAYDPVAEVEPGKWLLKGFNPAKFSLLDVTSPPATLDAPIAQAKASWENAFVTRLSNGGGYAFASTDSRGCVDITRVGGSLAPSTSPPVTVCGAPASALTSDAQGRVYVVGTRTRALPNYKYAKDTVVRRLTAAGGVDASFGTNGEVVVADELADRAYVVGGFLYLQLGTDTYHGPLELADRHVRRIKL